MKDLMNFRTILYVAFIALAANMLYAHFTKKPAAATANGAGTDEEAAG